MPPSGATTATTPRTTWDDFAACRDVDPNIFFGRPDKYGVDRHDPAELALAKSICDRCAVAGDCLAYALDRGADVYGIWGGSTQEDRRRLVRRIPRVKCPICASRDLISYPIVQVCGSCGNSWPTARPAAVVQPTATVAA